MRTAVAGMAGTCVILQGPDSDGHFLSPINSIECICANQRQLVPRPTRKNYSKQFTYRQVGIYMNASLFTSGKPFVSADQCDSLRRVPRRQWAGDSRHHIVQESPPAVCQRQLLRNSPDMTQGRTDIRWSMSPIRWWSILISSRSCLLTFRRIWRLSDCWPARPS